MQPLDPYKLLGLSRAYLDYRGHIDNMSKTLELLSWNFRLFFHQRNNRLLWEHSYTVVFRSLPYLKPRSLLYVKNLYTFISWTTPRGTTTEIVTLTLFRLQTSLMWLWYWSLLNNIPSVIPQAAYVSHNRLSYNSVNYLKEFKALLAKTISPYYSVYFRSDLA